MTRMRSEAATMIPDGVAYLIREGARRLFSASRRVSSFCRFSPDDAPRVPSITKKTLPPTRYPRSRSPLRSLTPPGLGRLVRTSSATVPAPRPSGNPSCAGWARTLAPRTPRPPPRPYVLGACAASIASPPPSRSGRRREAARRASSSSCTGSSRTRRRRAPPPAAGPGTMRKSPRAPPAASAPAPSSSLVTLSRLTGKTISHSTPHAPSAFSASARTSPAALTMLVTMPVSVPRTKLIRSPLGARRSTASRTLATTKSRMFVPRRRPCRARLRPHREAEHLRDLEVRGQVRVA